RGREWDGLVALGWDDHLYLPRGREGGVDASARVDRQVRLVAHGAILPSLDGVRGERVTLWIELLDACVPGVGHVHIPLSINGEADRLAQPTGVGAVAAPHPDEAPVRVEDLDPLVTGVGHVHIAVRADRHRARPPEDPFLRAHAAVRIAHGAPLGEEAPVRVKFLDAVIPGVGDVDRAILADRDPPRLVELAVAPYLAAP